MASATGFVVEHDSKYYLITNWHAVSGRHRNNGQPLADHGGTPTRIQIWHGQIGAAGIISWVLITEQLVDVNNAPRWLEHLHFGRRVDAVALPLEVTTGINLMPYNLAENPPILAADVPDSVNIIGFPYGIAAAGRIAVWVQGSIATDMEVHYEQLPCFLIDSRTRRGQSGSPVLAYRGPAEAAPTTDGNIHVGHGGMSRLLGVYSGRINEESDLGLVWKTAAITEILEHGVPGNGNLNPQA